MATGRQFVAISRSIIEHDHVRGKRSRRRRGSRLCRDTTVVKDDCSITLSIVDYFFQAKMRTSARKENILKDLTQ